MSGVNYIMFAGMAFWSAIGIYLFFLGKKQAGLNLRLEQMQALLEDKE